MDSRVTWTKVVYALHPFSLLAGIIGTATVVCVFLNGSHFKGVVQGLLRLGAHLPFGFHSFRLLSAKR